MTNETENPVLEILKRIQSDTGELRTGMQRLELSE